MEVEKIPLAALWSVDWSRAQKEMGGNQLGICCSCPFDPAGIRMVIVEMDRIRQI
jgi:hypothetical protein